MKQYESLVKQAEASEEGNKEVTIETAREKMCGNILIANEQVRLSAGRDCARRAAESFGGWGFGIMGLVASKKCFKAAGYAGEVI